MCVRVLSLEALKNTADFSLFKKKMPKNIHEDLESHASNIFLNSEADF